MVRPPAAAIRDLLDFWGLGDFEKFRVLPGPELGQKRRSGFSRSWVPFWAQRPPTKFDHMLNADPANPVWGPMCPWGPSYGPNNVENFVFVAAPTKMERFWPPVVPIGAVRTEKT